MTRSLVLSSLLFALVASGAPAEDLKDLQNPLHDAKAGEWAEYKVSYSAPMLGPPQEMPVKYSVVSAAGTEVEVKTELELMGMPQESTAKVDGSQSILDALSELSSGPMGKLQNVKILSSSVEDAEFDLQGTTYAAKKISVELSADFSFGEAGAGGMPVKASITSWLSYEVPVTGTLKQETKIKIDMGSGPMEITASQELVRSGTEAPMDDAEEKGTGGPGGSR